MDPKVVKLFDTRNIDEVKVPQYGWNVALDWNPPVKCRPYTVPRFSQIYGFVSSAIRYLFYVYRRKKKEGKKPFIDCVNPVSWQPIYGVPMGGIGSGAINRGYRGEFCRFSLIPGIYEYKTASANQFIVTVRRGGVTVYQQVLSVHKAPEDLPSLSGWNWQFPSSRAAYVGLFPRAWTVYDIAEQKIKLYCRQISPVIPHEYHDSCLPLCVFEWNVVNYGKEELTISICCVIKNGTGLLDNASQGLISSSLDEEFFEGCCIRQKIKDMDCCYGLGVMKTANVSTSNCASISLTNTRSSGNIPGPKELWENLMNNGDLSRMKSKEMKHNKDLLMATCGKVIVKPMSKSHEIRFVFVWHMPLVHFRDNTVQYRRRYARWFNYDDLKLGTCQMIEYAMRNVESWEEQIENWQKPILENNKYPSWYKSALFNELYFIVDGGTVWLDNVSPSVSLENGDSTTIARNKHQLDYGTFGYLEGHEYRMYNTYDVHCYSSWSLVSLWPKLQESIQYTIADATKSVDSSLILYIHKGTLEVRSGLFAIPHDVGDPEEEPFVKINAYIMYNTDQWKDLNPKFVLQVFRDWTVLKNEDYLKYMMPIVLGRSNVVTEAYPRLSCRGLKMHRKYYFLTEVMMKSISWDKDGDGIIENSGYADQTYDAWIAKGASAYTGGLWLSALYAVCHMSKHLNIDCSFFAEVLRKGKKAYVDKLWTGSYFKYDERCSSVMADQLCGHWYLKSCGVPDNEVFDQDKVRTTLRTIFQNNCVSLGTKFGAINGCLPNKTKDTSSVQSEEFWVGVNYALAATMFLEHCDSEAWTIAEGTYKTVYENYGLQFQTPESYFDDGHFRSLGYMRPLAIWSIQQVLDQR